MTGIISKLQPLDLNGQTYYYLKSNKETDDNPILYIIKMKV